jgi:hypothetical protein
MGAVMKANPWFISEADAIERDRIVAAQILDLMIDCRDQGVTKASCVLSVLLAEGYTTELYDRLMPLMNEELKQRGMG